MNILRNPSPELAGLQPCPFCSSPILAVRNVENTNGNMKYVVCLGCHAAGPWFRAIDAPAGKWNRRMSSGMTSETQAALAILRANAPMPFYLEQDNNEGTVVKDNHGEPIFVEWENAQETRMLPEEETIIRRSRRSALARFLVEISQTKP